MDVSITDRDLMTDRRYWLQRLSRTAGIAQLTLDHPRPDDYCPSKGTVEVVLNGKLYQQLSKLTAENPFLFLTALMTGLIICLYRYTGNRTIVVGSPARRDDSAKDQEANVIPVIVDLNMGLSYRELLLKVRETLLDAYSRQGYPFDMLIADLSVGAVTNRCPVFDVAMVLTNVHVQMPELRNDITVTFTLEAGQISGSIVFNRVLFDSDSVERLRSHLLTILSKAVENTSSLVDDMDPLTSAERHQLLCEWNNTKQNYLEDRCIQDLVEERVELSPHCIALVLEDKQVTYEMLYRQADELARRLRVLGVAPELTVAVYLDRSIEMVVGFLGILEAGGAYVPIDPFCPRERIALTLQDSDARAILAHKRLLENLPQSSAKIVIMDPEAETTGLDLCPAAPTGTAPDNLAYVIYTSGSTGQPNGVMVQHRSLVNSVTDLMRAHNLGPGDRLLQFLSPSFDAFGEELYPTLASGATLVLHRLATELSPAELIRFVETMSITALIFPAAYVTPLIDQLSKNEPPRLNTVSLIVNGGERLPIERLAQLSSLSRPGSRFLNAYGPTEATITSSWFQTPLNAGPERMHRVPLGRPIANGTLYPLGEGLQPVPIGVKGELYIGGSGLARGYLNQCDLTAERFIPNPFAEEHGGRLYRTGDLAKFRPDGQIEFLGRRDAQVKIHGFRIELGEIESALEQHPAVHRVVVQLSEDDDAGSKHLVAYLTTHHNSGEDDGSSSGLAASELRQFLSKKLPSHMVPSYFVSLDSMPLLPNGKVDQRALSKHSRARRLLETPYVAPRTSMEEKLVTIWAELFRTIHVGINDDFLELGGHSLLAFQLVSRLRDVFNVELPLSSVFGAPTVAKLAVAITHKLAQGMAEDKLTELLAEIETSTLGETDAMLPLHSKQT